MLRKLKLLEIKGEDFVTELDLEIDGNKETVATDFVFLYLGTKNNLELYGEFVSLSDAGYIVTEWKQIENKNKIKCMLLEI